MTFVSILQFGIKSNGAVASARQAIQNLGNAPPFVIGFDSQNQHVIQITSEWESLETNAFRSFVHALKECCGDPSKALTVSLNRSAFSSGSGPAEANVVEFAQSFFPESRVTRAFQNQIEDDFSKFDEIFKREAEGDVGLSTGWTCESQKHEEIESEMASSFIVIRGWQSMGNFQNSLRNESFHKALPYLHAWNAPHTMVSYPLVGSVIGKFGKVDICLVAHITEQLARGQR